MADKYYSILHIITRLDCGGSAENTLLTSIGFAEKKHEVTVLYGSNHPSSENEKIAKEAGVTFVRCKYLVRNISPINDFLCFLYIFSHIKNNRYDILHTHTSKAGIIGRIAGKLAGIPHIIHTPHGHIFYGYFSNAITRIFILIEWFTIKWTEAHIALTKQEKKDYLMRKIGKANRTYVIYSGISMHDYLHPTRTKKEIRNSLGYDDNHFICATAARLDPIKNHDIIIDSAQILEEYKKKLRFLFIGDGELFYKLQNRIQTLGLNSMFKFLGWRKDVYEI
ncbi:MAG: glycosyltransferase, partial [Chitinispirillia bacterium]